MLWTEKMFGVKKPIITMLHLDPLPGDPRFHYGDRMERVVEHARADLKALQDGGVDGVMFSNEFSLPYERHMSFITPACMARIIGELKSELRVPFGVDCISDGQATIELAAAVGAQFVRGTFSGVYVGDGGFYNNDFSQLQRRKAALQLDDLKMLYFINPESDRSMDTRPLVDIAKSTIFKAHPDGLCISANAAGQDVDDELIASVKAGTPDVVVLCNTGCRPDTIVRKLTTADAAVVGTYFKENGQLENDKLENVRVDINRVKEFMEAVRAFRKTL
ncbi:MAG: BtpA/SgcQ family protein [Ruthenibacterium sp.]